MTLHRMEQFDALVAKQAGVEEPKPAAKPARKPRASRPKPAPVPAAPRSHCDCTASRYDLIHGNVRIID